MIFWDSIGCKCTCTETTGNSDFCSKVRGLQGPFRLIICSILILAQIAAHLVKVIVIQIQQLQDEKIIQQRLLSWQVNHQLIVILYMLS